MQYSNLIPATLVKRYKRFLADVVLADGEQITVHCPNTGSMKNCADSGAKVWLLDSENPKRKYRFGWELVEVEQQYLACVNTGRANHLIREAIESGVVESLQGYSDIRAEVKYGEENSRIDLLLTGGEQPDAWVEIKNVTLLEEDNLGTFPDAVTARGAKHLRELMAMVERGQRAVLMFCVAHTGIERVSPADHIDPEYGRLLRQAVEVGVEVLAYQAAIDMDEIRIVREVPVLL